MRTVGSPKSAMAVTANILELSTCTESGMVEVLFLLILVFLSKISFPISILFAVTTTFDFTILKPKLLGFLTSNLKPISVFWVFNLFTAGLSIESKLKGCIEQELNTHTNVKINAKEYTFIIDELNSKIIKLQLKTNSRILNMFKQRILHFL